ncbi:hypothetical protein KVR01_008845 [Diaporthe batatas]|uniref:glutamate--tRNA ligase MSE1 n=1 Tax=Diaporthe batatas TaxID=748121 RepID=UPI001D04CBBF|nr:glutamate--tRNA ligase MSE1 [Diaporthe batatas]KAG8161858.1 hypothetical protein KVR01_008845 [Diaporthe batatas]
MSNLLLLRRRLHIASLSSRCTQIRRYALIGKPNKTQKPIWSLPESPARTRFAPSPTGYLHLGSLRTALFNYLLAQATGGQFILRLEDTDQKRFVEDAESRLYRDLRWAGLNWDEGPDKGGPFGSYKQSERLDLYRQHVDMLLEQDKAFRCFCSKEDLYFHLQQATDSGAPAHYPGTCMGISKSESDRRAANGEEHVVRFKTSDVPVSAPDLVYGTYKKAEREDNFIIMKTDGFPTYHFANVVDDHFMKITHVIRGAEWLISTPKHIELYNAFGWQPPSFAHVGLLVDHQRQKLSKRDIDNIGISVFRDTNILPEALLNFSVLLGWDPNLQNRPHLDKRGRMTLEEMKANFSLKFTRGDIVVDLAKLKFFQTRFTRDLISGAAVDPTALRQRILTPISSELARLDRQLFKQPVSGLVAEIVGDEPKKRISPEREWKRLEEEYIHEVLKASKAPLDNHRQFIRDNLYAFFPPSTLAYKNSFNEFQSSMNRIKLEQKEKRILNVDISKVLLYFRNSLGELTEENWTLENVGDKAKELADSVTYYSTEKDQLMDHGAGWKFLRWALFVGSPGLSVVPMMVLLGQKETLKRLRIARQCAAVKEEQLGLEAKRAKRQAELGHYAGINRRSTGDGQRSPFDQVSEPRNVKVRKHNNDPTRTQNEAKAFLRPTHPELHLPEKGPFWSQPRPQPVPDREPEAERPALPPQHISPEEFKTGQRHILSMGQTDLALDRSPWSRRVNKRVKKTPAPKPEPAAEIHPFEPGGSFFAPAAQTGAGSAQSENLDTERRAHKPQDINSNGSKPPPPDTTGFFMRGMSQQERRSHLDLLVAGEAEDELRQARAAAQMRPPETSTIGNSMEQGRVVPTDVPDGIGPFFAGKPVNHPLRTQAERGRPMDDEGERQPQDVKARKRRPGGPFYVGEPVRDHPKITRAQTERKEKEAGG